MALGLLRLLGPTSAPAPETHRATPGGLPPPAPAASAEPGQPPFAGPEGRPASPVASGSGRLAGEPEARRGPQPGPGEGEAQPGEAAPRAAHAPRQLPPGARAAFEAARAERQAERRRRHLEEVESEDLDSRRFAVGTLDATLPDQRRLLERALLEDPDAGVRREAAIQLGFGETREVGATLRRALADSSPEVLREVIGAIAFARVVDAEGELAELAGRHPSREIRKRARRALNELGTAP